MGEARRQVATAVPPVERAGAEPQEDRAAQPEVPAVRPEVPAVQPEVPVEQRAARAVRGARPEDPAEPLEKVGPEARPAERLGLPEKAAAVAAQEPAAARERVERAARHLPR